LNLHIHLIFVMCSVEGYTFICGLTCVTEYLAWSYSVISTSYFFWGGGGGRHWLLFLWKFLLETEESDCYSQGWKIPGVGLPPYYIGIWCMWTKILIFTLYCTCRGCCRHHTTFSNIWLYITRIEIWVVASSVPSWQTSACMLLTHWNFC
jgi:hypothetical protein